MFRCLLAQLLQAADDCFDSREGIVNCQHRLLNRAVTAAAPGDCVDTASALRADAARALDIELPDTPQCAH